ncbi:MAG: tRNA (5-methylaminomethyl-2-thiouridine)(34)-methyltransferase MnmD [Fibrobacteres bacterium]|nr:tRNA (5-methylaminomethyl-2-thiouridine)(34)-methyltransferase MnmD [Fibrobacterota bacterium]
MNPFDKSFADIPAYLINEHYNDRYFDIVNAVEEANYIHFEGNNILKRLSEQTTGTKTLSIGELGFGTGRNVVALTSLLDKSGLKNLIIDFYSVELFPITASRMAEILKPFEIQTGTAIDLLINEYKKLSLESPGWHTMEIHSAFGKINLKLFIGEALDMLNSLETPCECWFLDGHGPKANPEMWREELMIAVGKKTKPQGTCTTFTVARDVVNNLTAAGFTIIKWPGIGGKKSVLRGKYK